MTNTLIRQAGPYTVTTDGNRFYVNGVSQVLIAAPKGSNLAWAVETGCRGANGKPDVVGLTAEHYAIHVALREARRAERAARLAPEIARLNALDRKADAYDRGFNEGGEGYNPYRDGYAREATDAVVEPCDDGPQT